MDFSLMLTSVFWIALASIIIIDLVLAGDNAVVIGLAARNLPKENQNKVIFWGTAGAIIIRFICTVLIVVLLEIPGLLLVGGILLIWVAYKLLVQEKQHGEISADSSIMRAIGTIILADTIMGVDNMIAVAGAAHAVDDAYMRWFLIILGLLISIPIMVFGSRLVITLTEKYPIVIYLGSAVLAFTASKMILDEPFIKSYITDIGFWKWVIIVAVVILVILAGWTKKKSTLRKAQLSSSKTSSTK